jgi:hypothetical protein
MLGGWYHPHRIAVFERGTCLLERKCRKADSGLVKFQQIQTKFLVSFLSFSYRCIDYFLLPKSCVSLTFSASGSFLATAHVDDLGIYLWNNQSLYTQVSLRALEKDFEPKTAPLPGSAVKSSESEIEDSEQIEDDEEFSSPEQIADALVTLSLLPDSRWKNLLSLDAIKVSYLDLTLVRFIIIVCIYFNLLTETKQA